MEVNWMLVLEGVLCVLGVAVVAIIARALFALQPPTPKKNTSTSHTASRDGQQQQQQQQQRRRHHKARHAPHRQHAGAELGPGSGPDARAAGAHGGGGDIEQAIGADTDAFDGADGGGGAGLGLGLGLSLRQAPPPSLVLAEQAESSLSVEPYTLAHTQSHELAVSSDPVYSAGADASADAASAVRSLPDSLSIASHELQKPLGMHLGDHHKSNNDSHSHSRSHNNDHRQVPQLGGVSPDELMRTLLAVKRSQRGELSSFASDADARDLAATVSSARQTATTTSEASSFAVYVERFHQEQMNLRSISFAETDSQSASDISIEIRLSPRHPSHRTTLATPSQNASSARVVAESREQAQP